MTGDRNIIIDYCKLVDNGMNINDTFGKRFNIPVLLLSREDNL